MSTPLRESMSGADLAWLRMESPTNPMMVVGVMTLASRIRCAALRQLIVERLLRFERFRELPRRDISGVHWESAADFDPADHVTPLKLAGRATQARLEAAVAELASTPLDPRKPLWQIHLVERFGRGSALIARFHHCYADGIALLRVVGSLTDDAQTTPAANSGAAPSLLARIPLLGAASNLLQGFAGNAWDVATGSLHLLTHIDETAALAKQISAATAELARVATLPEDPLTPLRAELSGRKQVAWAGSLRLDEVKAVAHALDCSVNDVLLATVAGAFGGYLRARGVQTDTLSVRALVPVNMRAADEPPTLGNRFGLVFAPLPIGERNPIARLLAVHEDMQQLKTSAQPLMSLWLLTGLGLLPEAVERQAIELFTRKASLVISNVPGPQQPLHLAGARIEQELFWVPQAGRIGVGVSLLTYDGRVNFGLMSDANVIAAPRRIVEAFTAEFEKLLLCVLTACMPAPSARKRSSRTT